MRNEGKEFSGLYEKPALLLIRRPVLYVFLADHERRDFIHEIFAVIGVDLQRDGLREVQREDADDGFAVYHVAADAQVDVLGVTVDDIDEGLDVFCQAELDVDCFH